MAGFIKEKAVIRVPEVPADFTHALCTGQTGSGKTSGFILPHIENRIGREYGLLIVDVKGNMAPAVKALAHRHGRVAEVREIGPPWGSRINPLAQIGRTRFAAMLEETVKEGRDFWHTAAVTLGLEIHGIFELVENARAYAATAIYGGSLPKAPFGLDVPSFMKVLESAEALEHLPIKAIFHVESLMEAAPPSAAAGLERIRSQIRQQGSFFRHFVAGIDSASPAAGSGGVLFSLRHMMAVLGDWALGGHDDLVEMLERGEIVILRSDAFSPAATRVVLQALFERLVRRHGRRPLSIVIDEFQRVVTADTLPYVDLFREMRVELVAALQNLWQLERRVGEAAAEEFLGNIIHRFAFADRGGNDLEKFHYTAGGGRFFLSKPIFLTDYEIGEALRAWQAKQAPLQGYGPEWVYWRADGPMRCWIRHTGTGEVRPYFFFGLGRDPVTSPSAPARESKIFFD